MNEAELLTHIVRIAKEAGKAILPFHHQNLDIHIKSDHSPVTQADLAAHAIILNALNQLTPNIPVLSEESADIDFAVRQKWQRYWLVDPLDGTRGFINGSDEFTVNIALIDNHRVRLGVIDVPVTKQTYFADQQRAFMLEGDSQIALQCRVLQLDDMVVLTGHYSNQKKMQRRFAEFADYRVERVNSSWKFGRLAQGVADVYLRFAPTSEWDTAAGQVIVEAAGGSVIDFKGQPLRYNTKDSLINPSFMAVGDRLQLQSLLLKVNLV